MTTNTLSGLVPNLDEEVYHAHPALSSTGARQLLKAPAKFEYFLSHPSPHKKAYDAGTAVHSKVLGVGAGTVEIPGSVLSKTGTIGTEAARGFIATARAAGQTPLKAHEIAQVDAMAEAILSNPMARLLLEQDGIREASVFGTDPETGADCRARFDLLPMGGGRRVAVDLKTDRAEATPVAFAKTVADHGYHVQDAHYEATAGFVGIEYDAFAFVVVEKEPPFLTAVIVLDQDFREIGTARAKRARELFAIGKETGVWPGYPGEIQIARPPMWAIYDHQDSEEKAA
ncbi:PD-(D/E)XK nuclease-like domain-containing protein [Microbacterium sp. BH-3-3-3]|uniref:PD-(D/E)XK nuclease-like domain-containing protein n=1 Tax=Microbacterium sp. BH-3-3-3 TaxID=1906742 RepID=UPI0021B6B8CE|nr:PD-(D/E)XK nuclease-like domain-containing protein [Microbacterium sp. BH-3-3-3]